MASKVGINGFGRIGRLVTRALLESDRPVDLVGINDLTDREHLAHLFQHDSVHGTYPGAVQAMGDDLSFDGDRFRVFAEADPADLPWGELDTDVVIECTGRLKDRASLEKHLDAGAKRVVLSAPSPDADVMVVRGVNMDAYDPRAHRIISNASCTTNCLAPVLQVLHDTFGVKQGIMTTIHAVTNDQRTLDSPHKDLRRGRAAWLSMIPTTTGAARAIGRIIPDLDGKVDGMAVRVPTPNVSLVDLTARLEGAASRDSVLDAFREAAKGPLRGILRCESKPLVSVDFNHDPHSAIVDEQALMVVDDHMVKVIAWYDNEWGYANRLAELAQDVSTRKP